MPLPGSTLLHTRLFQALGPMFWRYTVTIQEDTQTQDEIGGISHSWSTFAGHEHIACNIGRKSDNMGDILTEKRQPLSIFDAKLPRCMLNGLYPTITEQHRAIVDGTTTYNIRGVISDSGKNLTELVLEIIT